MTDYLIFRDNTLPTDAPLHEVGSVQSRPPVDPPPGPRSRRTVVPPRTPVREVRAWGRAIVGVGMSRLRRLAGGLLLLSTHPLVTASYKYAKICELQNSPLVSLEFDEVLGLFSTTPSENIDASASGRDRMLTPTPGRGRERIVRGGTVYGRNNFLRGKNNDRLLEWPNLSDDASAVSTASKRTFTARSCPCDDSGRTYCLIDGVSGAAPDSCGVPWSDEISKIWQTNKNISDSVLYNTLNIGCFELSSQTVFTRNAVSIPKKPT